jgi:hypothetical protein
MEFNTIAITLTLVMEFNTIAITLTLVVVSVMVKCLTPRREVSALGIVFNATARG